MVCLFCKIAKKEIPAEVLLETEHTIVFMDIAPLSLGHLLVVPKEHHARFDELPDTVLLDTASALKKAACALKRLGERESKGVFEYNIIQNNGELAGQEIGHVHFHVIPKTDANDGLVTVWNRKKYSEERTAEICSFLKQEFR
ncbi:MAG: adenosine 5'-monophosphoramidase [Amphiamblys sp. WSBS2006]|nr:MAG: adenosine 5'-monophosphoramidase [Amphiamblys sp. WSBS2006]